MPITVHIDTKVFAAVFFILFLSAARDRVQTYFNWFLLRNGKVSVTPKSEHAQVVARRLEVHSYEVVEPSKIAVWMSPAAFTWHWTIGQSGLRYYFCDKFGVYVRLPVPYDAIWMSKLVIAVDADVLADNLSTLRDIAALFPDKLDITEHGPHYVIVARENGFAKGAAVEIDFVAAGNGAVPPFQIPIPKALLGTVGYEARAIDSFEQVPLLPPYDTCTVPVLRAGLLLESKLLQFQPESTLSEFQYKDTEIRKRITCDIEVIKHLVRIADIPGFRFSPDAARRVENRARAYVDWAKMTLQPMCREERTRWLNLGIDLPEEEAVPFSFFKPGGI